MDITTDSKKSYPERVAEKLIEQLKQGTAPWQKPWAAGEAGSFIPHNPTTGKRYKGINAIHLLSEGREDPRWMTYQQAKGEGAQVRKGEKGTPIQYWKFTEEQTKLDDNGKPVLDAEGKPVKENIRLERPKVFSATVFNAQQIDGLPPLQRKEQTWDAIERAEKIIQSSGADIRHGQENRAFYRPSTDSIHLPDKGQFPEAAGYYATALHELGHWTGHKSRLDRDLSNPFGSEGYAKEELRAEIASMIVGDDLGIGHDPSQHAAYVGSWIKVLRDDPTEIFKAASDAEKIHGYLSALEQKQVQEQSPQTEQQPDGEESLETQAQASAEMAYEHERQTVNNPASTNEDVTAAYTASQVAEGQAIREADQNERKAEERQEKAERTYIDVPYSQKDEAKALGARWDRQEQSWYVPPKVDLAPFVKWERTQTEAAQTQQQQRQYLAVPFGEHQEAKANGAMWDKNAKSWYAGPNADMDKLQRWKPENVQGQTGPAMSPRDEFAEALSSMGAVVTGEHPIMDGQKHRIATEGDARGEQAGFYVGHLDGHPAGYIKNNRTGDEMRWKSKGYALDPAEKAKIQAEAAMKLEARAIELQRTQEQTAQRISRQLGELVPIVSATPYLRAKGIDPQAGAFTDREGQKTYIPASDVNGKVWTMQYIQEDGTKRFAKDSRKEETFHVVGGGGMDALAKAPVLAIGEGYATAGSLSQALGFATVAAFDSGNVPAVAKALHEKFPDKPIVIFGDDDKHLEQTKGINPGKKKAEETAKAVGGTVLLPIFAPGEQSGDPKGFTDFNDLANKSTLGKEGVERQAKAAVEIAIEKQKATIEQKQEQKQQEKQVRINERPPQALRIRR